MLSAQRTFLHDIVAELLGLNGNKVFWAEQSAFPTLAPPYATLRLYSVRGEAQEEIRPTDTDGVVIVFVSQRAALEVQYYAARNMIFEPLGKLETLVRSLEKPTVVDKCAAANVAFFDAEPVVDISEKIDSQTWEPRAAVDLWVRFNSVLTDEPGIIEEVHIGDDDGEGGTDDTPSVTDGSNGYGNLVYGNISQDGTVDDYTGAINVNFAVKGDE